MEFASIVISRMGLRCFYDVACATRLMPIEPSRLTRGDFPRMIAPTAFREGSSRAFFLFTLSTTTLLASLVQLEEQPIHHASKVLIKDNW